MWPLAPLLVPLVTALLCVLLQSAPRWQRAVSLAGALALLAATTLLFRDVQQAGSVSIVFGHWPLPFGIEFTADRLGVALALIAALMLNVAVLWQWSDADAAPSSPTLHPLLHGLVAGVGGAFMTADLFNLYVWFEVALVCALGLLAHGGHPRQLDAALKYFVLNVIGTLMFLAAVALIYAVTGHLNFAAVSEAASRLDTAVILPLLGLLLFALLAKAAAFPLYAWLPASYHTLPAPVLALFSALLAKVGIYAILRLFGSVFAPSPSLLHEALGWIAVLSMIAGVLGAAYHWDMRRILAFHSISQIGYILLAIALASPAGDTAAIVFTLHHSIVKAGLILVAAMVYHHTGHYDLRRCGGLYANRPWLGVVFLLLALSLVGIPPFSGFWGKYLIVHEALIKGDHVWAACALMVSVVTLYSMMKIWLEAFWKPHPDPDWRVRNNTQLTPAWLGVGSLAIVALWIGLSPESLLGFANAAAGALRGDIK